MKDSWSHGDDRRDRGRLDRGVTRSRRSPSPVGRRRDTERDREREKGKEASSRLERRPRSRERSRERERDRDRRRPVSRSPPRDKQEDIRERNRGRELLLDSRSSGKSRRDGHQDSSIVKRHKAGVHQGIGIIANGQRENRAGVVIAIVLIPRLCPTVAKIRGVTSPQPEHVHLTPDGHQHIHLSTTSPNPQSTTDEIDLRVVRGPLLEVEEVRQERVSRPIIGVLVIEAAVIESDTITDQRLQRLQRKLHRRSVLDLVNGGRQSLQSTKPPVLTVGIHQGLQEAPRTSSII